MEKKALKLLFPFIPWHYRPVQDLEGEVMERLPSPLGRLSSAGDCIILSGRSLVACYRGDLKRPAWVWKQPGNPAAESRLYVVSRSLLECVRTGSKARTVWRRFLVPDFRDIVFGDHKVFLIFQTRILPLDPGTGKVVWRCALPFTVRDYNVYGPYIFAGDLYGRHETRRAGVVEISTGKLLWDKPFGRGRADYHAWDGKRIHLFLNGFPEDRRRKDYSHVQVDPGTGTVESVPFPPGGGNRPKRIERIACGKDFAFYTGRDGPIYKYSYKDKSSSVYLSKADGFRARDHDQKFYVKGPWLHMVQRRENEEEGGEITIQWVLSDEAPAYLYTLKRGSYKRLRSFVRGDRLFELYQSSVKVIDLLSGKERSFEIPFDPAAAYDHHSVAGVKLRDGKFWVFTAVQERRKHWNDRIRLDTFNWEDGSHIASQVLNSIPRSKLGGAGRRRRWEEERRWRLHNQFVFIQGKLIVTEYEGLHFLGPRPSGYGAGERRHMAYRMSSPVTVNGVLDEWSGEPPVKLEQTAGGLRAETQAWIGKEAEREATGYVGHDGENLYLAVRYKDPFPLPGGVLNASGGGDWLEIGLTTNLETYRWGIGFGERGEATVFEAGTLLGHRDDDMPPVPAVNSVSVGYNVLNRTLSYEVCLPFEELFKRYLSNWRQVGLSFALWDDAPGTGGPECAGLWGGGIAGEKVVEEAHRRVYLHTRTRKADLAVTEAVKACPELPVSFEFLEERCKERTVSWESRLDFYSVFIRSHPEAVTAERLCRIDRALRFSNRKDPSSRLVSVAESAGVPGSELKRYRKQVQSYLSQWVFMGSESRQPRSIIIKLYDGSGPYQKEHACHLYKVPLGSDEWMPRLRWSLPRLCWHEMRIPLVLVDMADAPLCGISFLQQGRPQLVWDRTSVAGDDSEQVLLDEETPPGEAFGKWLWDLKPVKSGNRAHTHTPSKYYTSHSFFPLKEPVRIHLPFDSEALASRLTGVMPDIGPNEEAWQYFQALLDLDSVDLQARMEHLRRFVKAVPEHPKLDEVLGELLNAYRAAGVPKPSDKVDKLLKEARVAEETCYSYRKTYTCGANCFLKKWRVLGPLAGQGHYIKPGSEETGLLEAGTGKGGTSPKVRWKRYNSETGFVDLQRAFGSAELGNGYAACWLYTAEPEEVVLEIANHGPSKVWMNGTLELSMEKQMGTFPGEHRIPVELASGWNELVIAAGEGRCGWGFYCELVDSTGTGRPAEVEVSCDLPAVVR